MSTDRASAQRRQSAVRRLLVAACLTLGASAGGLAAVVATARPADAHPILLSAEPADGASLTTAPEHLQLQFSEPVSMRGSTVELRDGNGDKYASNARDAVRKMALSRGDANSSTSQTSLTSATTLVITVPPLGEGVYQLRWRALSASDLHVTSGTLAFGIGRAAEATGSEPETLSPSLLSTAARWVDRAALAVAVGVVGIWLVVLPRASRRWQASQDAHPPFAPPRSVAPDSDPVAAGVVLRRHLARLGEVAAIGALVTGLFVLLAQSWAAVGPAGAGEALNLAWRTATDRDFVLRQLLLAALGCLFAGAARSRARRQPPTWALGGATVALAAVIASTSHVTARPSGAAFAGAALAAHLVAAGVWLGGVVALALLILPRLRRGHADARIGRELLFCFAGPALVCAVVVALTGLYLAGRQVQSLDALLRTLYGRLLIGKAAVVLVVGLAGMASTAMLRGWWTPPGPLAGPSARPRRAPRLTLHHSVGLEAAVGLVVLALAAALGESQPALGPRFLPGSAEAGQAFVAGPADDLLVKASITPNRPGRNFINIEVHDTRRPAPATITGVVVGWQEKGQAQRRLTAATSLDEGRWQVANQMVSQPGPGTLTIRVQRANLADAALANRWVVTATGAARASPVLISDRPLAPLLDRVALVGLAVALVALLAQVAYRRPDAVSKVTRRCNQNAA